MQDLLFTQKDGFVEFELPEHLQWADGEEYEAYIGRLQGTERDVEDFSEYQQFTRMFTCSDYYPGVYEVISIGAAKEGDPKFRVTANVVGPPGSDFEVIWVRTRGDLLALRIQLAQLQLHVGLGVLADLRTLATRMFSVYHGDHHDVWDDVCDECDSRENTHRKKAAEQRREIVARQRIAFLVNQETGRLVIIHLDQAAIASIQDKAPKLELVLAYQGTINEYHKLVNRFSKYQVPGKPSNIFSLGSDLLEYINHERTHRKQDPIPMQPFWDRLRKDQPI